MQVIVAGSTGVIGREILRQLEGRANVAVTALVRRPGSVASRGNVRERVFDFRTDYRKIGGTDLPCDVLLCAIGSTMKQAGSREAFASIERDIPVAFVERLSELGHGVFGFVSSTGAGKPVGFYLETKAAVEAAILASGVPHVVVRPSLILGDRTEFRLGERLAIWGAVPALGLAGKVFGRRWVALGRLMPIEVARIARALLRHAVEQAPAAGRGVVLEGYELWDAGRAPDEIPVAGGRPR